MSYIPNDIERPNTRVVYSPKATLGRLAKEFEFYFLGNIYPKPTVVMLLKLKQREEKTLSNFISRFTNKICSI